ncbi:lantibiotic dehydratase family protein, partial [Flavihumibacter sp. CACIAM 22H1]|uniref:lantibiotic dehydratase family protein n=1 Tax=Flavihumibacter sp. CACIAM 22H1 TaxID=1812911 RepID=UPI000A4CFA52
MKEQYQFHRNLVMRSPQLPLESRLDEPTLYALLQDRLFMEAVYLASPVLYEECRRIRQGEQPDARGLKKVLRSLAKYYTRMYSRCTPFGLFSGCGVAEWASGPTTLVLDPNLFYRHTRFDMHYVCALAQFLTGVEEIARQLGFKCNNSLYFLGNEARYIEYYYNQGKRTHKISSIQRNEYFDRVLQAATGYHRMETYADLLVDDSITKEEALGFIRELIHAQVLVSELEPSITGPEFIHQIKQTLQNLQADEAGILSSALSFLTKASEALHQLDHNRINDPASYDSIQALLRTLPVDFDAAKLFQCDLSLQLIEKKVADQYQLQLLEALELLHRLNPVQAQDMADFIREFKDRYEDRELPLLEVLDTETGIVYKENSGVELSPLLNDFVFLKPDQPRLVHWGKLENFWHKKLEEASAVKAFQIELQADDLSDFPTNRAVFPPSLS